MAGASPGSAAAADPWRTRSDAYYGWHLGVIGAELAASAAVNWLGRDHEGRWDLVPFSPDLAVRSHFSNAAAQASDRLRLLTLALPVAAQLSSGFDRAFGNAALIYTEVQTTNLFLTTLTKEIVRRPRPYTHTRDPRVREFARSEGSEAYASFYSGHASASYAAALSGSLLYAARTRELWARHFMWGAEFLLAGITAQLRVSAGRHYRTDVWFGSLIGAATGVVIPALHGLPLSRVRASEVAVAAGAVLLTHLGAELVDLCELLDCAEQSSAREPSGKSSSPGLEWSLLPVALPGGVGLQGFGSW
ncbi:MAG: phosphatase PAP2 family protein [Deltaproteobacteria bacterium]